MKLMEWRNKWKIEIADCKDGVGHKFQDPLSDCIAEADTAATQLEEENAALKRFVRKVHGGPHHSTIDATKCKGLVDWVCDTMDEAAALLTAEEEDNER